MSGYANPRKNYRWALEVDGGNQFLFQEIEAPTVEFKEIKHGAPANIPDAKTPGKILVGDIVLKKLKPATGADTWAWDWFGQALTGLHVGFNKNGFLVDHDPLGALSIEKFYIGNFWPKKIEDAPRQSTSDNAENLIQTVTFSVQTYFLMESPHLKAMLSGAASGAGGIAATLGISL